MKRFFSSVFSILVILLFIGIGVVFYYIYEQNQNLAFIKQNNLDGRFVPHKENRFTKMKAVLNDGIRSVELDMLFYETPNGGYFEIGHDKKHARGATFEEYLQVIFKSEVKKIWMDVKNVLPSNIEAILERLNYLDAKYHLKNIILFEAQTKDESYKALADVGYHTSYYLPGYSEVEFKIYAQEIAKQITKQHVKAISFPSAKYHYVKRYLEPIIDKEIVYHTWHTFKAKHSQEVYMILDKPYYKDPRVKTMLYDYFHIPYLTPLISDIIGH